MLPKNIESTDVEFKHTDCELEVFTKTVAAAVYINERLAKYQFDMIREPGSFADMLLKPQRWWKLKYKYVLVENLPSPVSNAYLSRLEKLTGFTFPIGTYPLTPMPFSTHFVGAELSLKVDADASALVISAFCPCYNKESKDSTYHVKQLTDYAVRAFGDENYQEEFVRLSNGLFRRRSPQEAIARPICRLPRFASKGHQHLWQSIVRLWLSQFASPQMHDTLLRLSTAYPVAFPLKPEQSQLLSLECKLENEEGHGLLSKFDKFILARNGEHEVLQLSQVLQLLHDVTHAAQQQ